MLQERQKAILIDQRDSVLTVLQYVTAGTSVLAGTEQLVALEDIPQYHKIARQKLQPGDVIYKYGQPMGYATTLIEKGQWIHTHNASSRPIEKENKR